MWFSDSTISNIRRNAISLGISGEIMYELIESSGRPIKAWVSGVPVDENSKQQLRNIASMPFIYSHIAVMPDVHFGMGATVGSVIATKGAIIPAAVGVDIGCGMMACRTSLTASDLPDNLHALRGEIEDAVPHGRSHDGGLNDKGAWREEKYAPYKLEELKRITELHPDIAKAAQRSSLHLGTLGTGNHFIEICLDEKHQVWVMLHSGSRGIGNRIGTYFISRAKKEMERWFISVPDKDLSYIPEGSDLFSDYCDAVEWAQGYARKNRELMMVATLNAISNTLHRKFDSHLEAINCHHNYVSWERHFGDTVMVTRKGAVDAHQGVMGIIPGSMGAKSFIVRGKGCRDSFSSCSHGAGRVMSRGEAKKNISLEEHLQAVQGVECRKDMDVIDESPSAYKDIDAVMAAQSDLVEIVHTLKQVLCVKG